MGKAHLVLRGWFGKFANSISQAAGSPAAFVASLGLVIVWLVLGPIYNFSDHWQLLINTPTTVITFLMVFVIQGSQNRRERALQLKQDEVIRSTNAARNRFIGIERLSDKQLDELAAEFERLKATWAGN